jgi:hypothetical protein
MVLRFESLLIVEGGKNIFKLSTDTLPSDFRDLA